MKLKELNIELQQWGEFQGQYLGKVSFEGQEGAATVNVGPEVSNLILATIGEQLASLTRKNAENLTESILSSVSIARLEQAKQANLMPAKEIQLTLPRVS